MECSQEFRISAVASRKVLCVNPKVQSLQAAWRINDECLQLQSKTDAKKQALSGMLFCRLLCVGSCYVACVLAAVRVF